MKTYTVKVSFTISVDAENAAEAVEEVQRSIRFDDLSFHAECMDENEEEDFDEYEEPDLEMGYDPYMGDYSWDC